MYLNPSRSRAFGYSALPRAEARRATRYDRGLSPDRLAPEANGHVLTMALRPGSIETGLRPSVDSTHLSGTTRPSEMRRVDYNAGEMGLIPRHVKKWTRTDDLHYLSIAVSDSALTAACDGTSGEVELREDYNLVDARVGG
jgi:hypothetical protein